MHPSSDNNARYGNPLRREPCPDGPDDKKKQYIRIYKKQYERINKHSKKHDYEEDNAQLTVKSAAMTARTVPPKGNGKINQQKKSIKQEIDKQKINKQEDKHPTPKAKRIFNN